MQNDMLKNNIAPWQEKGRWYHMRINVTSDTPTIDADNTDALLNDSSKFEISVSGNFVLLVIKDSSYYPIDWKTKQSNYVSIAFSNIYTKQLITNTTYNSFSPIIGLIKMTSGDIDFWVFFEK